MMKYLLRLILFAGVSFAIIWFFLIFTYYPVPNHSRDDILLIEWGWDTPDLQVAPDYTEYFHTLPFDGAIFDWRDRDGNLWGWRLFDNQNPIDESQLETAVADLTDFDWGNYKNNFLRYNINPGNAEWFDEWDVLLGNAEAWARFANELGFVGLMFDTEQYNNIPIFHYTRLNPAVSYEIYA